MKILNIILPIVAAIAVSGCIYPEDSISNVSVGISRGEVSSDGVTIYGTLLSGNPGSVSECGFLLFDINGNKYENQPVQRVSLSDFKCYYRVSDLRRFPQINLTTTYCRAYVRVNGITIYSDDISLSGWHGFESWL